MALRVRPEFQNPASVAAPEQQDLDINTADDVDEIENKPTAIAKAAPWPKDTIEQVRAVADTLAASAIPLSIDDIANRFRGRGKWKTRLPQLLDMLVALGRAYENNGQYLNVK